jgi:hypothetical protein
MRMITAAGASAVAVSLVLTVGCSRESSLKQPVQTQSEAGASTAPASGEAADSRGQALVRVVNTAVDATPISVMADKETAFSEVEYKEVTPYKAIPAIAEAFEVKPAAAETAEPLAANSETIMAGRHYTLVVFPEPNGEKKVSLDVIADDLVPPSDGKARIRVISAAEGTDDLAIHLRGEDGALFNDIDFKEAISYKEVAPANTTLEVRAGTNLIGETTGKTGEPPKKEPAERADRAADRPADRPESATAEAGRVLATMPLNLEAGTTYTIVLSGRMDGDSPRLDTLVVQDKIPQITPAPTE